MINLYTGAACHCRPGTARDNCPDCEGTGKRLDFRAMRAIPLQPESPVVSVEKAPARLTNRAAIRKAALSLDSAKARGFRRCSAEFLDRIEAKVKALVLSEVRVHPSKGKTLK